MQLSVIIVSYNVSPFLKLCLQSVYAALASIDAEIIVVDNASQDNSCEMVRTHFPKTLLIANDENVGFAKANNQGVSKAKGIYICILNPDTVVGETCFQTFYDFAKSYPHVGILGPKLIDGLGQFLPESKRNVPTPKIAFNKLVGSGKTYYANHLLPRDTGPVGVLAGAFMFMKRATYEELGGFDERYFMYGEDIDLSYAATRAGYTNYYLGAVPVLHFKGESTVKDLTYRKRFYGAMRLFYDKYFKTHVLTSLGVQCALFIAQYVKTGKKKKRRSRSGSIRTLYIGSDPQTKHKLQQRDSKEIEMCKEPPQEGVGLKIIFDTRALRFETILETMINIRLQNCRYRILLKNSTFVLGSDRSDTQGIVLRLDE